MSTDNSTQNNSFDLAKMSEKYIETYNKLAALDLQLTPHEQVLAQKCPNLFLDLFQIPLALRSEVTKLHMGKIQSIIDYSDKELSNASNQYINTIEKAKILIAYLLPESVLDLDPTEKLIIYGHVHACIRIEILKPNIAKYSLEKILTEREQKELGTEYTKPQYQDLLRLDLNSNIVLDETGNIDVDKSNRLEDQTHSLVSTIACAEHSFYLSQLFGENLKKSRHYAFCITDNHRAEALCDLAATSLTQKVYSDIYGTRQNQRFDEQLLNTQVNYKRIALEYLNSGHSDSDIYDLGAFFYEKFMDYLASDAAHLSDNTRQSISLEMFRIVLDAVQNWIHLPQKLFGCKFRQSTQDERKLSCETTAVIELFELNQTWEFGQAPLEKYICVFEPHVADYIQALSTPGRIMPNYAKNFVAKAKEPSIIKRIFETMTV